MNLPDLDHETRTQMLIEVNSDFEAGKLYLSRRFKPGSESAYIAILRDAVQSGDPETFADALRRADLFETHEIRNTSRGPVRARIPVTAPDTFAEGEFNRFYMRGLCARALKEGVNNLEIFRAKVVSDPRSDSEARIGASVSASELLDELRLTSDLINALHLPPGPNSGISVRLPTT